MHASMQIMRSLSVLNMKLIKLKLVRIISIAFLLSSQGQCPSACDVTRPSLWAHAHPSIYAWWEPVISSRLPLYHYPESTREIEVLSKNEVYKKPSSEPGSEQPLTNKDHAWNRSNQPKHSKQYPSTIKFPHATVRLALAGLDLRSRSLRELQQHRVCHWCSSRQW